ncbi:hypothetical protein ACP4OV_022701 [Aristida adscensionis]
MATCGGGGGRRQKFFKVLLPGSFELSLSIPPKFAAGLACRPRRAAATLRDPAGRVWPVDVDGGGGENRRVSFAGQGWRGFVAANGVSAGQLLVFEHRGGLDFAVDLFDASGCLAAADASAVSTGDSQRERTTNTTATTITSACNGGRKRSHADDDAGRKAIVSETTTACTAGDDMESAGNKRRAVAAAAPCTGVERTKRAARAGTTSGSCGDEAEGDASASHGLWRPDDEMLRVTIERPYQLRFLDVSKSFCERAGWTASREVELCAAVEGGGEERRWAVSVKVSSGKGGGMMCAGWAAFAEDNGVALSDACVFLPLRRLAGGCAVLLQVHVLRHHHHQGTNNALPIP